VVDSEKVASKENVKTSKVKKVSVEPKKKAVKKI